MKKMVKTPSSDVIFESSKPINTLFHQVNQPPSDNNCILNTKDREREFAKCSDSNNKAFLESFIKKMLTCQGLSKCIKTMEILRVIYIARKQFSEQGRMLELNGPVSICGDLHGQYPDLIRLFAQCGFPPETNYLFLGDYVDRGSHSLETILICLAHKTRFPNNFFMLRGNHELKHVNSKYGFVDEIFNRIGEWSILLQDEFSTMMDHMPLTALVGGRILCMHGGISPHITSLDSLRKITPTFCNEEDCLENDIMWSDPAKVVGWQSNPRGASYVFGEEVVKEMCRLLDIDLIVRGHQVVQDGYEFFAGRSLVTVFSAPHYMGSFTNSAAVCKVSAGLEISFEVLRPEALQVQERVGRSSMDNIQSEQTSGM